MFVITEHLFEEIKSYCLEALKRTPRKAFGLIFGIKEGGRWIAKKVVTQGLKDISRDPGIWPFFKEVFNRYGWPQCGCSKDDMGFMIDPTDVKRAKYEAAKEGLELIAVFHLHPCDHRRDQPTDYPSPVDRVLHADQDGVLCVIVHANSEGFKSFRVFKISQSKGPLPDVEEVKVCISP